MTRLPFTGAALDRASTERKDPDWVAHQLRDPAARAVLAGSDGVLLNGDGEGDGTGASEVALARAPLPAGHGDDPVLLGLEHGTPVFALDLDPPTVSLPSDLAATARLASLRDAGTTLPAAEAGLAAYAAAMLSWHRRHRFCANCGAATVAAEGGATRRCSACGAEHFPRTDPVVIMTVEHDGRLLLGRRAGGPPGRLSVLAGFVAPGESAEEAVLREVAEESGIHARAPVFVTSQPWPFPSSLMLGFHAESRGGAPRATDGELEEVGWYPREAVAAASHGDRAAGFQLPPAVSIARLLIERWLAA
ncbi:MAG: NAD(+) diphosphatase [Solirubrobacteraceae bacterium]